MIYLDSAATCFHRPPEVLQAVTEAMNSFGNPSRGGCGPALQASRMVFQAREALNLLFDGDGPEQVAFSAMIPRMTENSLIPNVRTLLWSSWNLSLM